MNIYTCVKDCPKISPLCMNIAQVPPLSGTNIKWISFAMQLMFLLETLPWSKQLNFQVIPQLSGWVWILKAEVPGIQPKQIPSWHVWRRGGRGRGRLKNGRGRVRWYSYIHPKIETQKLKYPEAVCLSSFCGRQSEKHAHTVLQIWQTRWRVNCYFSKEISTHLSQNHVKMW